MYYKQLSALKLKTFVVKVKLTTVSSIIHLFNNKNK